MEELFKKFYWLIITSICSLLIFLFSLLFNQCGKAFTGNPLKLPSSSDWDKPLNTLSYQMGNRNRLLGSLCSMVDTLYKVKNFSFRKCLDLSLKYDLEIKENIVTVEKYINELDQSKMFETSNFLESWYTIKNRLNIELKLWELFGNYSLHYLKDKNSFDWQQFRIDIHRQNNELIANGFRNQFIKMPSFLSEFLPWFIIFIAISTCIIGLIYLLIVYLVPIGLEIWNEKTENQRK